MKAIAGSGNPTASLADRASSPGRPLTWERVLVATTAALVASGMGVLTKEIVGATEAAPPARVVVEGRRASVVVTEMPGAATVFLEAPSPPGEVLPPLESLAPLQATRPLSKLFRRLPVIASGPVLSPTRATDRGEGSR